MTKSRAPLTVENAVFKVLGLIGAERAAEVTGRGSDYVRSLSDPDTRYRVTVEDAIKLDLAFIAAGGDGTPILSTYELLLEAGVTAFGNSAELAARTLAAIKEGGEANHALVAATLPGADAVDRRNAKREVEEAIDAFKKTLAHLDDAPIAPDTS